MGGITSQRRTMWTVVQIKWVESMIVWAELTIVWAESMIVWAELTIVWAEHFDYSKDGACVKVLS